ncbi:MAG: hypothetical protein GX075_12710 [Firmicutes bacterium]|nr:hypothetical protein [Bacillota bacterium]
MKPPLKPEPLPPPKIEIINLIDVLITLIAFFMFTTVFATRQGQLEIELPTASRSVSAQVEVGTEIGLTKENRIIIAGRLLGPGELTEYLRKNCRSGELVVVKADRECKYEWVISLLDRIKSSGITRVGLRFTPDD